MIDDLDAAGWNWFDRPGKPSPEDILQRCPTCGGTGWDLSSLDAVACGPCHGTGQIECPS